MVTHRHFLIPVKCILASQLASAWAWLPWRCAGDPRPLAWLGGLIWGPYMILHGSQVKRHPVQVCSMVYLHARCHGCILCPLGACAVHVQWAQGSSNPTKGSHTSLTTSMGHGSSHLQPKAKSCQVMPSYAKFYANMGNWVLGISAIG